MLYVAYGSNLDKDRMVKRCPSAKLVKTGYMKDTALDFQFYADIISADDCICPVAIYDIPEEEWSELDKAEDYPVDYCKKAVLVYDIDPKTEPVMGIAYKMTDEYRTELKNICKMPSIEYISHITKGYIEHGFEKIPQFTTAFYDALMRENLEKLIQHHNVTNPLNEDGEPKQFSIGTNIGKGTEQLP